MDEAQFALVSSIFTLGGFIGALAAGPISTKYGRLMAMRLLTVFFVVGSALEAVAADIPAMLAGRILSGVGAGASLVVVPIYISEIAPPQERGLFGVMTQITINVGLLIAQVLGYYLSTESHWRIILAVGSGLGLFNFVALFFLPESPAWTAANKDSQIAVKVLQRIRGKHHDISEEISTWDVPINAESEGLLSSTRRSSAQSKTSSKSVHNVGFLEVVRDPLYRPAIIAVIAVMCAQQFTGINSVMMYSVSVLKDVFPSSAALITIIISLVNFIMTVACAPLADTLGRKRSLLLSIFGMGASSLALAFAMIYNIKILSAIAVLCFVSFFAAGLGPIPFILASELVGQEARGAAQSWALGANWIATFLVAQFFPLLNSAMGGKGRVYFIFVGLAAIMGLFISWWVPETKGKASVDEVWGRERRSD